MYGLLNRSPHQKPSGPDHMSLAVGAFVNCLQYRGPGQDGAKCAAS
jgi:hypothetical protein